MRRALIFAAVLLASCGRKYLDSVEDPPQEPTRKPAPMHPILTPTAFEDASRPLRDAAAAVVAACRLVPTEPAGWFDYVSYDECIWKKDEVTKYRAAASWLESGVTRTNTTAEARSFLRQASLFGEWLGLAERTQTTRGTLRLYQDFANAWNRLAPARAIATEPPNILHQYFENMDDTERDPTTHFVDYVWKSGHRYEAHKAKGTPLEWHESAQGPFLAN